MHELLKRLRAQRAELAAQRSALLDAPRDETRDLNDEEAAAFEARSDELRALDVRIESLAEDVEREARAAQVHARLGDLAAPDADERGQAGPASVREPDLYSERSSHSFVADLVQRQGGDAGAGERLRRYQVQREQRASATTDDLGPDSAGGLIPPQYLLDEYASILRDSRVAIDRVRSLPLPASGMTFKIPKATQGTRVGPQGGQLTQLPSQAPRVGEIDVTVKTIGGWVELSRQFIERGSGGTDLMVFQDMAAEYAQELNRQVLVGDGSTDVHPGILGQVPAGHVVSFTSGSPTPGELYTKIGDAVQRVSTDRKVTPTAIWMTPRRWAFLTSTDAAGFSPLLTGTQGVAGAQSVVPAGVAGQLHGLPVVLDPMIPTDQGAGGDEDLVFVLRESDPILWEAGNGTPTGIRVEPGADRLAVVLVSYGYSAFSAERRTEGLAVVTGTGLVAPSF